MGLKLVTYQLSDGSCSSRIFAEVKKMGRWAKLSETSLVVDTGLSPDRVFTRLLTLLDKDDRIYVLELSPRWSGYGEIDVNAFLTERLQSPAPGYAD